MRVALFLALTGCNAVFGLTPTAAAPPIDAQYFDAPPDAPFMCPAMAAPAFSPYLHQVFAQPECRDFNAARDGSVAVASCLRPAQLSQGALVTIPELADPAIMFGPPRITPEGDTIYIVNRTVGRIDVLGRAGASWTPQGSLAVPFTVSTNAFIGTPSAGPPRRMMLLNNDGVVHELEIDAAGNATEAHAFTPQDLGGVDVTSINSAVSLTPDALHVVFVALNGNYNGSYFGSRASLVTPFVPAMPIAAARSVDDPFITADCGRLYFSAAGSVLYVQQ